MNELNALEFIYELGIHLIIFCLSLFILWKFVFIHIGKTYITRIAKTSDLDRETQNLNEEIAEKSLFLRKRLNEAREEAGKIKETLVQKAKEEASAQIQKARKDAHATISKELQNNTIEYMLLKKDLDVRLEDFKKQLIKEYHS